jgi:hypothetical protein
MSVFTDEYYKGQALQDKFILSILNHKQNGYFLEIGSNHASYINNTYLLETQYNWKGIMIDSDPNHEDSYKALRPNSNYVMTDATTINYKNLLKNLFPNHMDYLQIDLEPGNLSTLKTLHNLNATIFDDYKFATLTFEHDIYQVQNINDSYYTTREESRRIFNERGYIRVLSDVNNDGWTYLQNRRVTLEKGEFLNMSLSAPKTGLYPFEDWYVHPDLVNMEYINTFIEKNKKHYQPHSVCGSTINFLAIEY